MNVCQQSTQLKDVAVHIVRIMDILFDYGIISKTKCILLLKHYVPMNQDINRSLDRISWSDHTGIKNKNISACVPLCQIYL